MGNYGRVVNYKEEKVRHSLNPAAPRRRGAAEIRRYAHCYIYIIYVYTNVKKGRRQNQRQRSSRLPNTPGAGWSRVTGCCCWDHHSPIYHNISYQCVLLLLLQVQVYSSQVVYASCGTFRLFYLALLFDGWEPLVRSPIPYEPSASLSGNP